MPGGDRTGPMGMGPRTGRAAGYCGGFGMPGSQNLALGRWGAGDWGWGYGPRGGRGGGRGWRHWYRATGLPGWLRGVAAPFGLDAGMEKEFLSRQARALQAELKALNDRIGETESGEPPRP